MSIKYYVLPNNATTPPSFSVRVSATESTDGAALLEAAALQAGITPAQFKVALGALQSRIAAALGAGITPRIANYGNFNLSISAKLDGPNSPLPPDYQFNVNLDSTPELRDQVRQNASVERVEAPANSPQIDKVTVKGATLTTLAANQILILEGFRLEYHEERADEGVFLQAPDGSRFKAESATDSEKRAIVLVPAALPSGVELQLSVAARTANASPTSEPRTGIFNLPLRAS